jgi:hypothetical protein
MTDDAYPVIIRDDARFEALVKTWKYCGTWDTFSQVYEGKHDVPARLRGFTVIASNDPAEPYGALMQLTPSQAVSGNGSNDTRRKLLAKIRLD